MGSRPLLPCRPETIKLRHDRVGDCAEQPPHVRWTATTSQIVHHPGRWRSVTKAYQGPSLNTLITLRTDNLCCGDTDALVVAFGPSTTVTRRLTLRLLRSYRGQTQQGRTRYARVHVGARTRVDCHRSRTGQIQSELVRLGLAPKNRGSKDSGPSIHKDIRVLSSQS